MIIGIGSAVAGTLLPETNWISVEHARILTILGFVFIVAGIILFILSCFQAHRKIGVETNKDAYPSVIYESPWIKPFENANYACLIVRNKVACPSGDTSTSQHTRAKIEVFNTNGIVLHSWNGRWSDHRWPIDYADIDTQNQRDINAGDSARLDVGKRRNGEIEFRAWYNWLPSLPEPHPEAVVFNSGSYHIRLLLWAANMAKREHWFTLLVPNVRQSDSSEQVKIMPIKKPAFGKEDSHN
ncbi:hypothetical protein ACFLXX_02420 [Chloroflexota bacterium]